MKKSLNLKMEQKLRALVMIHLIYLEKITFKVIGYFSYFHFWNQIFSTLFEDSLD